MAKLNKIKTSLLSRSLSIAKLGINAGIKYAGSKITQQNTDDMLVSQAQLITGQLGELKGSLMKAGQMLSMYGEYFFPPQANQILKTLQSESPAIEWNIMQGYLKNYIGEELFDELIIDPEPIGCASLGQVHKAQIKASQKWIALKIQYPDLDKAIDSDIKALKTILKISRLIPDGLDLQAVFEEVKIMLLQELDYRFEAELTEKYFEKINSLSNMKSNSLPESQSKESAWTKYRVPQVIHRYCHDKVLATEYLDGLRADHPLIQSLSQTRRNRISENFLDLYFKEIFEWNLVQTDPHLGNYKIEIDPQGNDKIILLDFGACRLMPENFMISYRKMIQSSIQNNEPLFFEAAKELGFIIDSDSEKYINTFIEFCNQTVEPFWLPDDKRNSSGKIAADGTYHWKQTDLPGRVLKKAIQFKNFDLRSPPKDIIFLDRKTGGVFIFLSVLRAQINGRKIIEPYFIKST